MPSTNKMKYLGPIFKAIDSIEKKNIFQVHQILFTFMNVEMVDK